MLGVPWLAYLVSEFVSLSGIVAIIVCGITMAKYSLPNLTNNAYSSTKLIYEGIAHNFEILSFIFMGMAVSSFKFAIRNIGLKTTFYGFLLVQLSRLFNVLICSTLSNLFRDQDQIGLNTKLTIWFCGFRGAIGNFKSLISICSGN